MRWLIRMLIVLLVLVVLAVIGAAGFYFWLDSFLKGDSFRLLVSREASKEMKLEGEFLPLHWQGSSVFTDGYHGTGLPGEALRELHAEQIRAEFNMRSVLDGEWRIPQITAQRVSAVIASPDKEPPPGMTDAEIVPEEPGWLDMIFGSFLPTKVVIGRVDVNNANVTWRPDEGGPISLNGLQLIVTPDTAAESFDIYGTGGKLTIPEWPPVAIPMLKLRFANDTIYVTEAELRPDNTGSVRVSGDVGISGDQPLNLVAEAKQVPVEALVKDHWLARLTGILASRMQWTGSLKSEDGLHGSGPVVMTRGRLEALPALETVARLTRMDDFRNVRLDEATAQVDWTPQKLQVTDLVLRSDGLLWVTGSVTVIGEKLDGRLQVGTPQRMLNYIPGAEKRVFTEERDGYLFTPVHITGTTKQPVEDLTPRLQAAALNEVIDTSGETIRGVIEKARSLLPAFLPGVKTGGDEPQPATEPVPQATPDEPEPTSNP